MKKYIIIALYLSVSQNTIARPCENLTDPDEIATCVASLVLQGGNPQSCGSLSEQDGMQSSCNDASKSCPMPSDERLVCEVLICNPVGLAIPESRSQCLKINVRFAIYLATLGFWDSPPSCKSRDKDCRVTGRATNQNLDPQFCENNLTDQDETEACWAAIGLATEEYCDRFVGVQRDSCFNSRIIRDDFCTQYAESSNQFNVCEESVRRCREIEVENEERMSDEEWNRCIG